MATQAASYDEFKNKWLRRNQASLQAFARGGEFKRRATEKFQENIGVLSLTVNDKSLLMWAHYAQSHEGMLIEFRPKEMFHDADTFLVPVEYSPKRPRASVGEFRQHDDLPKRTAPYRIKSCEWQYEAEWRAFALLSTCDKHVSEAIHLFHLAPQCIQRVALGCRVSKLNQERQSFGTSKLSTRKLTRENSG